MGKYFTERERYQLETYLNLGMKVKEIAQRLGKCEKTIYNEIKRGQCTQRKHDYTEKNVYLADVSQNKYLENRKNKGANLKIGNDLEFVHYIEELIGNQKYSPYAALEEIKRKKKNFKTSICVTTLYSYIDKGIFLNITNSNLPLKKTKKAEYRRTVALKNLKGKSIEERAKDILKRDNFGHWELDTVVSGQKKGNSCLLVFTERTTRYELIYKMPYKKAECVVNTLNDIEKRIGINNFRKIFKTITCDNGVEFLKWEEMERGRRNKTKTRTQIYFCHPYCSSERGSNENQNRLIRRFIPKGSNIDEYTDEQILYIQNWMNNYPRKLFKGLSANKYIKKLGISA